ncbi:MAG: cell division protein FtsA [Gemmatimonadales bacterium]|nr:cell division protein FtsA [Gemmatimonadales bacterium]
MGQGRLIVACDFGTTYFRGVVTEADPSGELEIIGCAQEKSEGFQDGDFVDLGKAKECIARTLKTLEKNTDIDVSGFTYNISGSHLHSVRATSQVPISNGPRPIKESDVEEAKTRAGTMDIPFDNKILTITPVEFAVDRVRGIVDPINRVGSHLEMQAHLITGSRTVLHNIENAIEDAGYQPIREEVDILAAGVALLTRPEMENGVLLMDVGGLVTNWAVYIKGTVVANGMVPWGGEHLTADLAHGLRISLEEAEKVKRLRGVVLRSLVAESSVETLFEENSPEETPELVAAILEPRLEEIFTLVKQDYGDLRQLANLGSGVILTGGGSLCEGTVGLCEEIFDLPVQGRYLPFPLRGGDRLPKGQWATALGLASWVARDTTFSARSEDKASSGGLWGWICGLFSSDRD